MGMFDSFVIREKSNIGIPTPKQSMFPGPGYQTKEFGCTLATINISPDGLLSTALLSDESRDFNEEVQQIISGKFSGVVNMYGDDETGYWHEFELTVVNNQIVKVMSYDKVLYDKDKE